VACANAATKISRPREGEKGPSGANKEPHRVAVASLLRLMNLPADDGDDRICDHDEKTEAVSLERYALLYFELKLTLARVYVLI